MTTYALRETCTRCNTALPLAAADRCPFCRKALSLNLGSIPVICRHCHRQFPRAHAGRCLYCTATYLHRTEVISGKGYMQ